MDRGVDQTDEPDPVSRRESAGQQRSATDVKAGTVESDGQQEVNGETDDKPVDTTNSPLEAQPSYGGFDNLQQEFDARADSRRNPEVFNTRGATERQNESRETEINEAPGTSSAEEPLTSEEPGSWRGKGGQYLNAEENLVCGHALDRIQNHEPKVTNDLRSVEAETDGKLTGLEYRLKGEDRFKEKMATNTRQNPELSMNEIAGGQHDAIRYTFQFTSENYVQGYANVKQRLEDRGYELTFSRNSWNSPDYKGLNTRWQTPEGQMFEVQFHTPESFSAKQETHEAYERLRTPGISKQEHEQLRSHQREVTAEIPTPDGVNTIKDYRRG
jgi:hypothetical protein